MFSARKQSVSGNNVNYFTIINISVQLWFVVLASNFEMHKIYRNSTLLLIGVEDYSTPVGKRDSRDPEANTMLVTKALSQDVTHLAFVPLAEEAARRSPTGSFALRESE
jgi:hypothetical protein